ncbi:MAG: hypothetical protein K2P78_08300 [Gemmataceae bacterium]|nr:hypothetical protein [Gemmataceae bacterium]
MATITIPDVTYQRLAELAANHKISVADYVTMTVFGTYPPPVRLPTREERLAALAEVRRQAEATADRYPPGFQVDDSRESIYREREDAQL